MNKSKSDRLKGAGWKVGTAQDFLGLSDEETALIEMKLALSKTLRRRRINQNMTQGALAKALGSSQSRIAKMESADPTVSMELLVKGLLALGATRREVGRIIGQVTASPAA